MISSIAPVATAISARPPQSVQAPEANARAENASAVDGASAADDQPGAGQRVENALPGAEVGDSPEQDNETGPDGLTADEQRELEQLKARDREVRAHEQAHLAAAGSLARGGPTYTYERGPDQQLYAVGGEVQIDTSEVPNDPQATIAKAQIIRRAALAPAEPSAQDRAVAAEAAQMASEARMELAAEQSGVRDSSESAADDAASTAPEDAPGSCPACGGAHSADAHEGMTAYAAQSTSTPERSLVAAI